ncbi:MAG: hypothetical protein AAFN43_04875 [Pseudomonadota bacterium]
MFFIRAGQVMAWLMVVSSSMRILFSLFLVFSDSTTEEMAAASRHFLGTSTTGEAIDEALIMFAGGIVLGLLVEIAKKRG